MPWPTVPARGRARDHRVLAPRGRQRDRGADHRHGRARLGGLAHPAAERGVARDGFTRRCGGGGPARGRGREKRARFVAGAGASRAGDDHPRLPRRRRRDGDAGLEDEACHSWPLCGAGFTPDFAGVNAYTMLHRGAVLLIGALLVFVLVRGMRQPGLGAVSIATLLLLGLQVAVGAGSATTANELFNGLHVALATLVWAGMLTTAMLTLPRTDRAPQLSRLAVEKGFE